MAAPPSFSINLNVSFKYNLALAPSTRRGMVIHKSSGSAHLTFEPAQPSSSWLLSGDIWSLETGSTDRGLYVADFANPDAKTNQSIIPYRILMSSNPDVFDGGTF